MRPILITFLSLHTNELQDEKRWLYQTLTSKFIEIVQCCISIQIPALISHFLMFCRDFCIVLYVYDMIMVHVDMGHFLNQFLFSITVWFRKRL